MTTSKPTYPLERIKQLAAAPTTRIITGSAQQGAGDLGLDEADIVACVLALDAPCFYKTMPAEKRQGLWQDVYRPTFEGYEVYLKVQIVGEDPDNMLVVISFKRR